MLGIWAEESTTRSIVSSNSQRKVARKVTLRAQLLRRPDFSIGNNNMALANKPSSLDLMLWIEGSMPLALAQTIHHLSDGFMMGEHHEAGIEKWADGRFGKPNSLRFIFSVLVFLSLSSPNISLKFEAGDTGWRAEVCLQIHPIK
jgi:hypothetical protein